MWKMFSKEKQTVSKQGSYLLHVPSYRVYNERRVVCLFRWQRLHPASARLKTNSRQTPRSLQEGEVEEEIIKHKSLNFSLLKSRTKYLWNDTYLPRCHLCCAAEGGGEGGVRECAQTSGMVSTRTQPCWRDASGCTHGAALRLAPKTQRKAVTSLASVMAGSEREWFPLQLHYWTFPGASSG